MRDKDKKRRYTNVRDLAQKQREGQSTSYLNLPKGAKLFKPKVGIMLLDILPFTAGKNNPFAEEGMLHWERSFWVHNNIGVNNDRVICPAKTFKEKCPICEFRMKLRQDEEGNEEQIKALGLSHRQLFNVYNRKDPDAGVQILDISHFCFGDAVLDAINSADEDEGVETFFLAENGKTLKVNFDEESFSGTKFLKASRVDFKDRREDLDEDLLEQAACLDELLAPLDYKELKKMVLAVDEDEDDEDEKPKKGTKSRATDADDDDDDGEDEKPKKGTKSRATDADDDDDDGEDDEDEKPKSKKKSEDDDDDGDGDDDGDEDEPKAKKKAPKDKDDWDDFDDEDDEDEKPKGKKSKDEDDEDDEDEKPKSKKKAADEDDDDDGEDGDDEDEKPKSKKKNAFAKQKGDKGWDKDDEDDE